MLDTVRTPRAVTISPESAELKAVLVRVSKLVVIRARKERVRIRTRRIANFLEMEINENKWDEMVYHCTFDYMKQPAEYATPPGGAPWKGGPKTFVHKSSNGRWRDILSDGEKIHSP